MSTIQLRTAIPGPRSQALMKRRDAAVVRGTFHATPVFVAKAEGAVVEDVDGNCFNVLPYESYIAVCEKLNVLTPGKGPKKSILVNTGAEAVENAIKIARCY